MDDIIVLASSEQEAIINLKKVLQRAEKAGLEFNWTKCQFLERRVEFLGHIIENGTIRPSEDKIKDVQNFSVPTNIKAVQSFLGFTGYFRKFIANYSVIDKPLSDMLRGNNLLMNLNSEVNKCIRLMN